MKIETRNVKIETRGEKRENRNARGEKHERKLKIKSALLGHRNDRRKAAGAYVQRCSYVQF